LVGPPIGTETDLGGQGLEGWLQQTVAKIKQALRTKTRPVSKAACQPLASVGQQERIQLAVT
jgi:hypothetical protein